MRASSPQSLSSLVPHCAFASPYMPQKYKKQNRYFVYKSIFLKQFWGFEGAKRCEIDGKIFLPGYDPPAPKKLPNIILFHISFVKICFFQNFCQNSSNIIEFCYSNITETCTKQVLRPRGPTSTLILRRPMVTNKNDEHTIQINSADIQLACSQEPLV